MLARPTNGAILLSTTIILILLVLALRLLDRGLLPMPQSQLLSDPFLQLPTENSIRVIWFTEFAGSEHTVTYGRNLDLMATATTTQLTRTREDRNSRVGNQTETTRVYQNPTIRDIWRHEAHLRNLTPAQKIPYRVTSVRENGETVSSEVFTLSPQPAAGTPLKILLTSDHQLKPMTAANLQKVAETVGKVDAVFFAGDLVNVPDRASEWFDDNRGTAFFPCLQGRANYELDKNGVKTTYAGGQLIQHAPLFPAIGNHEVMGRFSMETSLNDQFNDAYPRTAAEKLYKEKAAAFNRTEALKMRDDWLENNTFNIDTYSELFTLPQNSSGGEKYYAVTFGDIRLVVLYITNVWRVPSLGASAKGKFRERDRDLNRPEQWGYGQHIFEPIAKGSPQYNWLERELNSSDFQQAKYKLVMFHHPPHSLGENVVPAYTDPVQEIDRDAVGNIKAVRYEYPKPADYIIRDVVPLLEKAGVQLVLFGHSHLWNRFISASGMNFLETSNVGNTYGANIGDRQRLVPSEYSEEYVAAGNPNGLEPIVPTLVPLIGEDRKPLPYIASNDLTVFSILDTGIGTVSSYYFDTRKPASEVVKFDEFGLKG